MLMTDPATAKAGGDPTNGGSRHASPAPGTHDGGEGDDAPEIRASRESTPGADRNAVVQTRCVIKEMSLINVILSNHDSLQTIFCTLPLASDTIHW